MRQENSASAPGFGAPRHPWFTVARAGLIVWRMPARMTNDDVMEGIAALASYFEKAPGVSAWILDMSNVEEITPMQRKLFADSERRIAPLTKIFVSRLAYVVPSPLIRAILTAYFWVWHPPYPYEVFGERNSAEAWALGKK